MQKVLRHLVRAGFPGEDLKVEQVSDHSSQRSMRCILRSNKHTIISNGLILEIPVRTKNSKSFSPYSNSRAFANMVLHTFFFNVIDLSLKNILPDSSPGSFCNISLFLSPLKFNTLKHRKEEWH